LYFPHFSLSPFHNFSPNGISQNMEKSCTYSMYPVISGSKWDSWWLKIQPFRI
jgi:hypothetical protein